MEKEIEEQVGKTINGLAQFTHDEQVQFFIALKNALLKLRVSNLDDLNSQANDIKQRTETLQSGSDVIFNGGNAPVAKQS